jgi:hypothetical protein
MSPIEARALKGTRIPVLARDRETAIALGKQRAWWTRCLNPDAPFSAHGRYWFVVGDELVRGLEEFARTARTVSDGDK